VIFSPGDVVRTDDEARWWEPSLRASVGDDQLTPSPSCGRGERLERLFCAIVPEHQDITIQLLQDIRKAKRPILGPISLRQARQEHITDGKSFCVRLQDWGENRLSRRSGGSDLLHCGGQAKCPLWMSTRSKGSISLAATSCCEWFSLVSPCVAWRMRRSNFIGLPRLGSENVPNLWQNLA